MYQYDTVSEAVAGLQQRGYTENFTAGKDCLICGQGKLQPEEFAITEFHRFEGASDPADQAIVYAVESDKGWKGVLVNGYGYSEEELSTELADKLRIHLHQ